MQHNYEKIKVSLSMEKSKDGEERKIRWKLEILKTGKKNMEELITWFQKEADWTDLKILRNLLKNPGAPVLYMKSPREGLKNFALFIVKDIDPSKFELAEDDEVRDILDNLPEPVEKVDGEAEPTAAA